MDRVKNQISITEIVSGMAKGADNLGVAWARFIGLPCAEFPADWEEHGRAAGPIRNAEMAEYADALVAFWDGKSRGTKNMIDQAIKRSLLVKVIYYNKEKSHE